MATVFFACTGSLKMLAPRLREGDKNSYISIHEHPEISVLDSVLQK